MLLAVLGTVLPYSQFLPWLADHGADLTLALRELFSTRMGAFFAFDVIVSAFAASAFMRHEGRKRGMRHLWLPISLTFLVGVSCGLPLFLYLREVRIAGSGAA